MELLFVGIHKQENQITRQIKKSFPECEFVYTDSDPGKFYLNADAAIIVTAQISHKKFEQVKNAYSSQKKRIFVTRAGYSSIKEDVEVFLKTFPTKMENKMKTVAQARDQYFTKRAIPEKHIAPAPAQEDVVIKEDRSMQMIDDIVSSAFLNDSQKIQYISKVRKGEISSLSFSNHSFENGILVLQSGDFTNPGKNVVVRLCREQAELVALYENIVVDFAEGKAG